MSSLTVACFICTPPCRAKRTSASAISMARSLTGNTRLPRSVFSATPSSSKQAMVSCGVMA